MRKIGPFEILGLLGQGGMSKVYKVRHPLNQNVAALKILSPRPLLKDLLGEEALKKLFMHEARLMAGLAHPNIAAVKEFSQIEDVPYYLMEYYCNNLGFLMGETYRPEKPSRAINPDQALGYLSQTLTGLTCLHRAGIVHRDVKPFNLLLTDENRVKISDFGLALWHGETYSGPPNLKVGSPYYTAPEQEEKPDQPDPRSDLYSAGVIFYRMVLGRLPLGQWKNPSLRHPNLDDHWDDFMRKALSPNKAGRFQSAVEMLRSLNRLTEHWERKKEAVCAENRSSPPEPLPPVPSFRPVRADPVHLGPPKARSFFGLDPLWRPLIYSHPDLQKMISETLYDKTASLLWQQKGSASSLTWEEAHRYITRLNQDQFAGCKTWRLPTIDELCTLLREVSGPEESCLASPFDHTQRSLWSSDRRSYGAAWQVNVELGFISWQDFTCHNYVRAVTLYG